MKTDPATGTRVRFGTFVVDLRSGELRRDGLKVKIQELPFQVLVLLLERPGEVVAREDLRTRLWPADTFIDFEHGLNKAINKVREALGDDANNPRFVETLTRRGYRFIAPVETQMSSRQQGSSPARRIAFGAVVIVAVLAVLLALNVAGLRNRVVTVLGEGGEPPLQIHSIAVLPLDNLSGDPKQDSFARGMTEELSVRLSRIPGLRVIAPRSTMIYKGSKKSVSDIARELNVDAVIEGSVLLSDDRVHINIQLEDGTTQSILLTQPYERNMGDVLTIYSDVARDVTQGIRVSLTQKEQQRLVSTQQVKPKAYLAYLQGRDLLGNRTGDDVRKALGYFKDALEIDPNYAPAHAGLSDAYVMLAYYGPIPPPTANANARAAALKAIELDDSLAEAHDSLAEVHFHYDWDWSGTEREFRRAIVLNPGYSQAHQGYSVFLEAMGRYDEALDEIKNAQRSDPYSLIIKTSVGSALFYSGKYGEAVKQWESIRKSNPDFFVARAWLGFGYLKQGRPNQALQEFEAAAELSNGNPPTLAFLGYGYAQSGKTAKAYQVLRVLAKKAKEGYVSPYQFAIVYTGLGKKYLAIEYLQKAFQEHYTLMVGVNIDPFFRPLRSVPRFQAILRRMNFPP